MPKISRPNATTPQKKLIQTRRRVALNQKGLEVKSRERRTYSRLVEGEARAAFDVYKRIRRILSEDKKYFLNPRSADIRIQVKTPVGTAVIENVRKLREEDYFGNSNWGILKVTLGKREMFVKIEDTRNSKSRVLGASLVNSFLKKQGGKIMGFNFEVAPVHVAHDFLLEKASRTIYATDFYPKEKFVMIENLPLKTAELANSVIKLLNDAILAKYKGHVIGEISMINAMYDPKTKTIVLFDLHANSKKPS
jgi:hypothetical protein